MNPHRAAPYARRIVGVALLALVLAQWAALVHTVMHTVTPTVRHATVQAGGVVEGAAAEPSEHAAGSPVCQLVDHLLVAQTSGGPQPQLPEPPWSTAAPPWALLPALPRQPQQGYDARGPPQA